MADGDQSPEARVAKATGLSFYEKRREEVRERLVDETEWDKLIEFMQELNICKEFSV